MKSNWKTLKLRAKIMSLIVSASLLLAPVFVLVVLPLSIALRLVATLLAKLLRPDLSHILDLQATMMALELIYSSRPNFNILTFFQLEEEVSFEGYRRAFEDRVLYLQNSKGKNGRSGYQQLRQTCTQFMGFLFWKWDANFDAKNHIRTYDYSSSELRLPSPCTMRDIERVTGELIAAPWPEGRSPWEILLVTCKDPTHASKNFTLLALRIHHAMADGFSILEMLSRVGDNSYVKVPRSSFPESSLWRKFVQSLVVRLRMPYDLANTVVTFVHGSTSWRVEGKGKYLKGAHHVFFSDRIPVERFKEIRRKYGVGYNAAVYAVAMGTVRRMMIQAGQPLPERMVSYVPLPLPDHPGGLTLHISSFLFSFSPRIASAAGRMRESAKIFETLRQSPTVPIANSLAFDCMSLPPIYILRLLYGRMNLSVGMTNFPGPEGPLMVAGKVKATDMTFALGHPPGTLGAVGTMLSYRGMQRIVFTIDKQIFQSYQVPDNFSELINMEIEELLGDSDGTGDSP